jgi:nucleotidyltransferase substrate binding protein (TIGR01987 family)
MIINTHYLQTCIATLEASYERLQRSEPGTIDYELYRNSLVKGFELTLEQSFKLFKKHLVPYFATKKALDKLTFKDTFRYALTVDVLSEDEITRWFLYRDNRNDTAHDYGQHFAETTLTLIPIFLEDARRLNELLTHAQPSP